MRRRLFAVASAMLLAGGCDVGSEPVKVVKLTVEPPTSTSCTSESDPTAARVSWDAASASINDVKIFVRDGSRETLFAAGGATGSAETGKWVRANLVFVLKDGTGRSLAEHTVNCAH
jgi:hypothetical protein